MRYNHKFPIFMFLTKKKNLKLINSNQGRTKTILVNKQSLFVIEELKKKKKLNFINNFNFISKNFFLKNSKIMFKFNQTKIKTYKIPLFFLKKLNLTKNLQKKYSQMMVNLFWRFSPIDFEFFVKYLFTSTLIKYHKNIFFFINKSFSNVIDNFSQKLIYLSITFKGKLSGVGNSRKRSLKLSKGPFYNKAKPRFFLKIHLSVKIHYFFIYTTTGVSSVTTIIRYIS